LQNCFDQFITQGFEYRIPDLDIAAARTYSEIMEHKKDIVCPMSFPDGQIAANTLTNHLMLATRNIKDFTHYRPDFSGKRSVRRRDAKGSQR
jgi:predicted nucleic acid-binding protein